MGRRQKDGPVERLLAGEKSRIYEIANPLGGVQQRLAKGEFGPKDFHALAVLLGRGLDLARETSRGAERAAEKASLIVLQKELSRAFLLAGEITGVDTRPIRESIAIWWLYQLGDDPQRDADVVDCRLALEELEHAAGRSLINGTDKRRHVGGISRRQFEAMQRMARVIEAGRRPIESLQSMTRTIESARRLLPFKDDDYNSFSDSPSLALVASPVPPQRAPEAQPAPAKGKQGKRRKRVSCNAQMYDLYDKDPMVYLRTARWFAEKTGYSAPWVVKQKAWKEFQKMRVDDANGRADREQTKRSHDEWQQAFDDELDGEA